jgi:esterase/lipase superfamily enzyme
LSFTGAPIVYSWPSRGTFVGYPHDATTSEQSIARLKAFLLDVARRTPAKTIHLIGHSMGNRPLTRAVADLAGAPEAAKFRYLILAAPDIDAVVFREQIAPHLTRDGRRITLYANSKDNALLASKVFNGAIRAGDSTDPLTFPGIDTIDASNVITDFLGHSTFVPSVLMDIFSLLRDGRPPGDRFAMEPAPRTNPTFWMFRPVAR